MSNTRRNTFLKVNSWIELNAERNGRKQSECIASARTNFKLSVNFSEFEKQNKIIC